LPVSSKLLNNLEGGIKKKMKMLKSKKALSPVVASIILIAVTVAVSIAVAAWMGALTFTFTKTEELKITGILWSTNYANLTLTNTGASDLTISGVKVDQAATTGVISGTTIPTSTYTLAKGATKTLRINNVGSVAWTSGTKYTFAVLTAAGNQYEYPATKP
jgi:flagellin-like protein